MKSDTYDFQQFQRELAALDRANETRVPETRASKQEAAAARLLQARREFTALRERYGLSIAHVVAFFPEEEGIAYLQTLITQMEAKPARRSKSPAAEPLRNQPDLASPRAETDPCVG